MRSSRTKEKSVKSVKNKQQPPTQPPSNGEMPRCATATLAADKVIRWQNRWKWHFSTDNCALPSASSTPSNANDNASANPKPKPKPKPNPGRRPKSNAAPASGKKPQQLLSLSLSSLRAAGNLHRRRGRKISNKDSWKIHGLAAQAASSSSWVNDNTLTQPHTERAQRPRPWDSEKSRIEHRNRVATAYFIVYSIYTKIVQLCSINRASEIESIRHRRPQNIHVDCAICGRTSQRQRPKGGAKEAAKGRKQKPKRS